MSEGKVNGTDLNKNFLEYITNEINHLIKKAEPFKNDPVATTKLSEGNWIMNEDTEKYNKLMSLNSFLGFKDSNKNEVYEIELPKGTKLPGNPEIKIEKIYLEKSNDRAINFADQVEIFEDLLNKELNANFKFPVEIYQLKRKYQNQKLPGMEKTAPEPKLVSDTPEEYEEKLRTYYEKKDTPADTIEFREAYIHEQINYREENKVKPGFTSDYYQKAVERHTRKKLEGVRGKKPENEKVEPGKRMIIKDSELNQETNKRIGQILQVPKNFFKDGNTKRRIGYILGGGVTLVALSSAVIANPGLLSIASPIVLAGVSATLAKKADKKWNIKEKIRKWVKDSFFGPQVKEESEEEPEEVIEEEDTMEIETDIESFLEEQEKDLSLYMRILYELKLKIAKAETLDINSEEYKQLRAEIETQQEELQKIVSRITELNNQHLNQGTTGGPKI